MRHSKALYCGNAGYQKRNERELKRKIRSIRYELNGTPFEKVRFEKRLNVLAGYAFMLL